MPDEFVLLARYHNIVEAEICKATLEAEGIPVVVFRDDVGGMDPQLQLTQGIRLMVRDADLERARELLDLDQ